MECGHAFCDDCWRGHLGVQIREGHSRRLRCMAPSCPALCDEDKVPCVASHPPPMHTGKPLPGKQLEGGCMPASWKGKPTAAPCARSGTQSKHAMHEPSRHADPPCASRALPSPSAPHRLSTACHAVMGLSRSRPGANQRPAAPRAPAGAATAGGRAGAGGQVRRQPGAILRGGQRGRALVPQRAALRPGGEGRRRRALRARLRVRPALLLRLRRRAAHALHLRDVRSPPSLLLCSLPCTRGSTALLAERAAARRPACQPACCFQTAGLPKRGLVSASQTAPALLLLLLSLSARRRPRCPPAGGACGSKSAATTARPTTG